MSDVTDWIEATAKRRATALSRKKATRQQLQDALALAMYDAIRMDLKLYRDQMLRPLPANIQAIHEALMQEKHAGEV